MERGSVQRVKREELTGEVALLLKAAEQASRNSSCSRRRVGAAGQSITDPARVYVAHNGLGCDGILPCVHQTLLPGTEKPCKGIHAEISLLNQANSRGDGVVRVIVTTFPCKDCARAMIDHGLQELYYVNDYGLNQSFDLLLKEGVNIIQIV